MKFPKPWYRKSRGVWYVTLNGSQITLGRDRERAFVRYKELISRPPEIPKEVASKSVAGIIDSFLDWTKKHRAARTFEWYLERTSLFVKSIPDFLTVEQLKPYHLQDWLDGHPTWSNGHRRGCIIAVQRALRWALKMGYIESSPIAYFEKPQAGKREQLITSEEFETILSRIGGDEFHDLLVAAWEAGPRPQELLVVEARHVDLKNSRWIFPKDEAKGKKRVRIVYLTDTALDITQRQMLKHPDGPIFRNSKGRRWTPYSVNCRFERLQQCFGRERMKEVGVELSQHPDRKTRHKENGKLAKTHGTKYCLYAFRHSYATRLLEAGVDALTVSILLGHSDTTMLGKVYQHLSHNPKHLLDQVRKAVG